MNAPTPRYVSVQEWLAISNMGRRTFYERVAAGQLKAVKLGARTLVDLEASLAWMKTLPPAKISPPRRRSSVSTQSVGATERMAAPRRRGNQVAA